MHPLQYKLAILKILALLFRKCPICSFNKSIVEVRKPCCALERHQVCVLRTLSRAVHPNSFCLPLSEDPSVADDNFTIGKLQDFVCVDTANYLNASQIQCTGSHKHMRPYKTLQTDQSLFTCNKDVVTSANETPLP